MEKGRWAGILELFKLGRIRPHGESAETNGLLTVSLGPSSLVHNRLFHQAVSPLGTASLILLRREFESEPEGGIAAAHSVLAG